MAEVALFERLQAWVGCRGETQVARDPVNLASIRRWVEAFEDDNPRYVDARFDAERGIVAPPAMLNVWDKPGQGGERRAGNPQAHVLALLEEAGFTSTLAVNCELEFTRYLRPGDLVQSVQTLETVTGEKETAVGRGHFVTARYRYETADGDHVGGAIFRVLQFAPGTGRPQPDKRATPPVPETDPDPAKRPRPGINLDNQFFWDGARRHELRIQACRACGTKHFPPTPRCTVCGSFDMGYVVASGRGHLYSWAIPHHPQAAGFTYPVMVGLVDLEEGTRLVSNIVGCRRQDLRIGMPLEVSWLESHPALVEGAVDAGGAITLPQFRPARPPRRTDTLTADAVAEGDDLPLTAIPITPTLIISCAFAALDFTEGHHDPERAMARGMKGILTDVHTSLGLTQRWISDWAGPTATYKNIRIRLGEPNYAGDLLTLAGSVVRKDPDSGEITVAFCGFNSRGDHLTGTSELMLPATRDR